MSGSLIARNVLTREPAFELAVENTTPFYAGGSESKRFIEGEVDGRKVTFVERAFCSRYVDAWTSYQRAGLPVLPDVWATDRNTLLLPDAKADGAELYGKSLLHVQRYGHSFRRRPVADERFLEVMQTSRSEIFERAIAIGDIAAAHTIRLAVDDPLELRVRPNGTWDVLALDLEGTVVPANLDKSQYILGGGVAEPHLFASDNRQFVQHFQGDLEDLQTALSKQARLQA